MATIRLIDVRDADSFGRLPPCADPAFDHSTCDYWEDADRGARLHAGWRSAADAQGDAASATQRASTPFNPFAPPPKAAPGFNPFALSDEDLAPENPFAPARPRPRSIDPGWPRKLALLARGLAVFGSYAKVLLVDDEPAAYAQFGPLSAYPRALRLRELYPQLPQSPLPAAITCIATARPFRGQGLGTRLAAAVCDELGARGFAAVEAYPEAGARPDATSAASPAFWIASGFTMVVADEHFPVMRRDLE